MSVNTHGGRYCLDVLSFYIRYIGTMFNIGTRGLYNHRAYVPNYIIQYSSEYNITLKQNND